MYLKSPKKRTRIGRLLRNYFLTGLIVTGPIGITILLANGFVGFIDEWLTPLIPDMYHPNAYLPFDIPGTGLLLGLLIIFLVGGLTASFIGRSLISFTEKLIENTPVIGSLYATLKQIFQLALKDGSASFSAVVLVEYPCKGVWVVGFVTNEVKYEIADYIASDTISIFLPTTPNPTSGYVIFMDKQHVKFLDMSVENGIKLVISGGIVISERMVSLGGD